MSRRPIQASIRTRSDEPGSDAHPISEQLREALSLWASGVAILAVSDGEDLEAITVSAFSSVSLEPPLVLACVDEQAAILPMLLEERRFTVSVLPENAERTASMVAGRMPLRELPFAKHGDPLLQGALVGLVCRLWQSYGGGDHRIVVGEVERIELGASAAPLIYFGREYRGLREGRAR